MSAILVYSEREDLVHELLAGAHHVRAAVGGTVAVALLGPNAADQAAGCFDHGAEAAYVVDAVSLSSAPSELTSLALLRIVETSGATTVLVGSTLRGKVLAPRLAQMLGAGCVTDALSLDVRDGHVRASRYAFGGKTIATEEIVTPRCVIAVAPKVFEAQAGRNAVGQTVFVPVPLPDPRVRVVDRRPKESSGVNLEDAQRLVCIGRGLKSRDDLHLIEQLARVLGAELGCTRSLALDYGWLPEDRLVGLSGKRCKPRLYVAIGLSGQIQHLVGVSGARTIVAINRDETAPIFEVADYGIVGDLYQVVPRLIALLT